MEIKPSLGNNLLWRIQYQYNQKYYIDAVHIPWFGSDMTYYQGGTVAALDKEAVLGHFEENSVQRQDIEDFIFFSDGWVAERRGNNLQIGDVRFAMFPNHIDPLWYITLDWDNPNHHVEFYNHRERKEGDWQRYWNMIIGKDIIF